MSHPLRALTALGQAVWYDNLSREVLRTGELKRMIEEDGVSGATPNPTIFEKALTGERIYDHALHALVDTGDGVQQIYEELAAADVRDAADLLYPVYESTEGTEGYVSLDVSPHLAYDTAGTIDQARRLFALVNRRNLMINVPATIEGMNAAAELLAEGININVTLIFSQEQYRDAMSAYIQGVERWIDSGGEPGHVCGTASFFINRVDSAIDEILREIVDPKIKPAARSLLGKAAIANAKIAYATYMEVFHGPRFALLRDKGARPQRILWAGTSTTDPEYADTYYVDALIGPETINTLPKISIDAYRRHGKPAVRLYEGVEAAREVFIGLEQLGIDVAEVMDALLENGVKLSTESFDHLVGAITKKRTRLIRGWGHRSASLGDLQKRVDEKLAQFDEQKVAESLWAGDVSLWTDDPAMLGPIARRLGWLPALETMIGETHRLRTFADDIKDAGFTVAVLLGMGGSSLASEVFATCFGSQQGFLDLKVLNTTVPDEILALEQGLDLEHTLFVYSSKSGRTVEAQALYAYFRARMESLLGEKAGSHFIAITDPGTSLGRLAGEQGFRKTFLNPPTIGGRFSALSYFGLVPAALMGMDLDRLLMRASQSVESAAPEVPALENQGMWLGTCLAEASLVGKDKLSLIMSPGIERFGLWLEQLVAESTGKEGKGIVPIVGESMGAPDVYDNDRLFVYLRLDDEGGFDEQVSALERYGHPVITLRLHTPFDLGREIFRWQLATAIAGVILRINPFDEPQVAECKTVTRNILDTYKKDKTLPRGEGMDVDDPGLAAALADFLSAARPGDYVAFNAFIRPTEENRAILQSMRVRVRGKFKTATGAGFGPRHLYATGQMQKGGADKGLFIQITSDDKEDAPVPGKTYSFGVLKTAQALADYKALQNRGRRVLRVHLREESDLSKVAHALRTALPSPQEAMMDRDEVLLRTFSSDFESY